MKKTPTILVFDSGLGGLTVFREVAALRPDARFVYAADDNAFPYGQFPAHELSERVVAVMTALVEAHKPDLAVIACNTASTLVLAELRRRFAIPFVGTVPAIKPACTASASKLVSVLGTEATVKREYTHALIRDFGQGCAVTLVGSSKLAIAAEAYLRSEVIEDRVIADEIAACFVESNSARTDTIVLACTHYPLLIERFAKCAPWPVNFIDPAPAIARRVVELLGPAGPGAAKPTARMIFTSGKPPSPALRAALTAFGVSEYSASTA